MGGTWSTPPALPAGWVDDERVSLLRQRAESISAETPDQTLVADPNLSLVQPLWEEVGNVPATILCLRQPGAVADSLVENHHLTVEQGLFLWFRYNASATINRPDALIIEFESLLDDPEAELTRVASFLELDIDSRKMETATSSVPPPAENLGGTELGDAPIEIMSRRLHELLRLGRPVATDETVGLWARLTTSLPWAGPGDTELRRVRRELIELSTQIQRLTREERRSNRRLSRLETDLRRAQAALEAVTFDQTASLLEAIETKSST